MVGVEQRRPKIAQSGAGVELAAGAFPFAAPPAVRMIGERVPGAAFGALTANHGVTCYIWAAAEPLLAGQWDRRQRRACVYALCCHGVYRRPSRWLRCCFTHYILHLQTLFRFPARYLHASRHSRCAEKSLTFVLAQSLSYASPSGSLHCRFLLLFKSVQVAILRRASISTWNRQLIVYNTTTTSATQHPHLR